MYNLHVFDCFVFQILFFLVCISLPSPRKGGDIRGRTRYRGLAIRKVGEVVGSERMLGREVTGTKRRARVPIRKDRRESLITRNERKNLSKGGQREQRRRQRINLTTENTLLNKTYHGNEGFSEVDINKEDKKEEADIYIGQASEVNENTKVGISNTNDAEIIDNTSKNVAYKQIPYGTRG